MAERGEHTLSEIMSQPTIWADALTAFDSQSQSLIDFWRAGQFEQVLLTGCGSTRAISNKSPTLRPVARQSPLQQQQIHAGEWLGKYLLKRYKRAIRYAFRRFCQKV